MRIMVMDGQGGGVGRSLLEALKERFPEAELIWEPTPQLRRI